jgi:hypothetical protein
MKLLALSDIHNNLIVARKMRAQEKNVFDAIVVAGDIGDSSAEHLFNILKSFKCPIMYVYGNWDASLDYRHSFGKSAQHLHHRAIKNSGFVFVGYSGCDANWGNNPIACETLAKKFKITQSMSNSLESAFLEYRRKKTEIEQLHDERVARFSASNSNRRSKHYQQQLIAWAEEKSSDIAKIRRPMLDISGSTAFRAHPNLRDSSQLKQRVLRLNREKLLETIQKCGATRQQLIVVTHDRTPWKYLGGAQLHLFGHRHGFNEHVYKGTKYVNVSALDGTVTARPKHLRKWSLSDCRNINAGSYVTIEMRQTGDISVKSVQLNNDYSRWTIIGDRVVKGLPCITEERIFAR